MRTTLILLTVVALAACSPAVAPSPSPAAATAPPPSPSPSSVAPPSATAAPSVAPSTAFAACDLSTWQNLLPSGRLVRVTAASVKALNTDTFKYTAALDTVTFQFAPGGDNPGTPIGDIKIAKPPFTQGASGQPMSVAGDHFLQVRFEKMDIVDAAGNEIYSGSTDIKPGLPALRQAIQFDAFEGVIGWYVGLAGSTCVTVASDPAALTITLQIAHP